jgi:hypothetical protein
VVFTPVVMKSSILWDITTCSPVKVNRRFGWTCRISFHVRKVRHMKTAANRAWLIIQPWIWRRHIPPKYQLSCNGLHGFINQNIELFTEKQVWTWTSRIIPRYTAIKGADSSGNTSDLYSGRNFESRPGNRDRFRRSFPLRSGKHSGIITKIKPRPLPSTSSHRTCAREVLGSNLSWVYGHLEFSRSSIQYLHVNQSSHAVYCQSCKRR